MGHFGRDRVFDLARKRFYWPKMQADIKTYIDHCENCLKRKQPEQRAELTNIVTSQPMEMVSMDFLCLETSVGGYSNILVLTDHFTRFAMAVPTRNQTAKTTAKILIDLFTNHYGIPGQLHSDQGPNFTSKVIKEMCTMLGIRKTVTTVYHPMSNGQTERFNRTLLDMLGTLPASHKSRWSEHVKPLVHAYNCSKNEATGYSPFELMFGRAPRLPIDQQYGLQETHEAQSYSEFVTKLRQNLDEAYKLVQNTLAKYQHKASTRYNLKQRGIMLQPGDRVLIKKTHFDEGRHKLANRWEDKVYVVVKKLEGLPVYDIHPEEGPKKVKRWHRNNLLPLPAVKSPESASEYSSSTEFYTPQQRFPSSDGTSISPASHQSSSTKTPNSPPVVNQPEVPSVSVDKANTKPQLSEPVTTSSKEMDTPQVPKSTRESAVPKVTTIQQPKANQMDGASTPVPPAPVTNSEPELPQHHRPPPTITVDKLSTAADSEDSDSESLLTTTKARKKKLPLKSSRTSQKSSCSSSTMAPRDHPKRKRQPPARFRSGDYVMKKGTAGDSEKVKVVMQLLDYLK